MKIRRSRYFLRVVGNTALNILDTPNISGTANFPNQSLSHYHISAHFSLKGNGLKFRNDAKSTGQFNFAIIFYYGISRLSPVHNIMCLLFLFS